MTGLNAVLPDLADGFQVYARGFARGLRPPPDITISQWAEKYREIAATSSARPGKWSNATAPYLTEVMDCLSPSYPCRQVTFVKSAQVGGTECGINFFNFIAHIAPGPMGIVLPTVDMAKTYNRNKLTPAIEATKAMANYVEMQKSRDEKGSTMFQKNFKGGRGYALITGANSSSSLQMHSFKYLLKEEISEWPFDAEGRGDPDGLADTRTTAFSMDCKIFNVSTPNIKGMCRVTTKFEAGDQRRFYMPCPHCETPQVLVWGQLKFREEKPYDAQYACIHCGALIAHHQKRWMLDNGFWKAENPGIGREPSFHINQLYSPFVSWDDTVDTWLKARGNLLKEKVFYQQVLGEAWEQKGDAPDTDVLLKACEDYALRRIPMGCLYLTGAVDVQHNRLEFAVYAWDEFFSRWLIDKGIIEGDPTDELVWKKLGEIIDRRYEDAWGRYHHVDAYGIDTGYLSSRVYLFCRKHAAKERVYALDGRGQPHAPPLGSPKTVDIDMDGKKIGSVLLWPVGTSALKAEHFGSLRKMIAGADGDGLFQKGTMHCPRTCDEEHFNQLTAERFDVVEKRDGMMIRKWVKIKGRSNEQLDLAVYTLALAHHLADPLTDEDWKARKMQRLLPPDAAQRDMTELWNNQPADDEKIPSDAEQEIKPQADNASAAEPTLPAAETQQVEPVQSARPTSKWLNGRGSGWLKR